MLYAINDPTYFNTPNPFPALTLTLPFYTVLEGNSGISLQCVVMIEPLNKYVQPCPTTERQRKE